MKTKKIVDYKIVTTKCDDVGFMEFSKTIVAEAQDGWELAGGICALHSQEVTEFKLFQAMVKYENKSIKPSNEITEISDKYYENLRKLEVENMKAFNERFERDKK